MRLLAGLSVLVVAVLLWLFVFSDRGIDRRDRSREAKPAAAPPSVPEPRPEAESPPAVAWRAVGKVAADGARVLVLLDLDGYRQQLATTMVKDGSFAVALPQLAGLTEVQQLSAGLVATVVVPRYRPGESEGVSLKGRAPGDVRLDIDLEPGAVVTGRVVDRAGMPIADAEVWFSPHERRESTATDQNGRYALPITQAAPHWLCARKGERGAAVAGPFQLSPSTGLAANDLVLQGPGRLSGVAVYPDGTPVPNMTIQAVPARLRESKISRWPGPRFDASKDEAAASGLDWGWVRTGVDGRFVIAGLRLGKYFFYEDKTRALYPTGADVRVVIARHRIRIRCRDEWGRPVHGVSVSARADSGSMMAGSPTTPDAEIDLAVRVGDTWTISLGDRVIEPVTETVKVVADKYDYPVTLLVRLATRFGTARVSLLGPDGRPVEGLRVSLATVEGDNTVLYNHTPEDGRTPPVPAGRYVLEAAAGTFSLLFPAEKTIEIRADAETAVEVQARAGGRVRVTVKVEKAVGIRCTAHPKQGGKPIAMGAPLTRTKRGYRVGGLWAPDSPAFLYHRLEPGPYELEFVSKGFKTVRVPVLIRPGEVTDVELELERSE